MGMNAIFPRAVAPPLPDPARSGATWGILKCEGHDAGSVAALRAALPAPEHGWLIPQGAPANIVATWRRAAQQRATCPVCRHERLDLIERMLCEGVGLVDDVAAVHGLKGSALLAHARLHLGARLKLFGVPVAQDEPWRVMVAGLAREAVRKDEGTARAASRTWIARMKAQTATQNDACEGVRGSRAAPPMASAAWRAAALARAAGPEAGLWFTGQWWPGVMPALVALPDEAAQEEGCDGLGGAVPWDKADAPMLGGEAFDGVGSFAEVVRVVVPPAPARASLHRLEGVR